jgi:hypothetical protein
MNTKDYIRSSADMLNTGLRQPISSSAAAPLGTYPSHQNNPHYDCHHYCHKESRELLVVPNTSVGVDSIDPAFLKSLAGMVGLNGIGAGNSKTAAILGEIQKKAEHGSAITPESGNKDMAAMHTDLATIAELAARGAKDAGVAPVNSKEIAKGVGSAIIGGCCCVHLSIEYLPSNILSELNCAVAVGTMDSAGTLCAWAQICGAQSGYEIREHIISTNPGARLVVVAVNAIARIRWCEHFAC